MDPPRLTSLPRINQTQNMEATKVAGCSTEGGKPEPSWKSQGVQQLCASTKGCVVITKNDDIRQIIYVIQIYKIFKEIGKHFFAETTICLQT